MLVLTRKLQQQIKIGDQITVTILRVKGHTVRIGIEAPRDVRVVRGELPPKCDDAEFAETTIIEARVSIADGNCEAATDEAAIEAAAMKNEAAAPAAANVVSPPVNSALPPRHVLKRVGRAPLRQIMANTSLAK